MCTILKKNNNGLNLLDTPSLVVKTRRLIGEIKGRILSTMQLHWNQSLIFTCLELFTRETVVSLIKLCCDRCGTLSHRCRCSSHIESFGRDASWVCCPLASLLCLLSISVIFHQFANGLRSLRVPCFLSWLRTCHIHTLAVGFPDRFCTGVALGSNRLLCEECVHVCQSVCGAAVPILF